MLLIMNLIRKLNLHRWSYSIKILEIFVSKLHTKYKQNIIWHQAASSLARQTRTAASRQNKRRLLSNVCVWEKEKEAGSKCGWEQLDYIKFWIKFIKTVLQPILESDGCRNHYDSTFVIVDLNSSLEFKTIHTVTG